MTKQVCQDMHKNDGSKGRITLTHLHCRTSCLRSISSEGMPTAEPLQSSSSNTKAIIKKVEKVEFKKPGCFQMNLKMQKAIKEKGSGRVARHRCLDQTLPVAFSKGVLWTINNINPKMMAVREGFFRRNAYGRTSTEQFF